MSQFFAQFDLTELIKSSIVLFAVIDVIGSVPMILRIKEQAGEIHPFRTAVVAFAIMIAFLIFGESILALFGVNIESFAVAGSILLFAMSAEMILGIDIFRDQVSGKTASIVPLAFPILAGAGSMTTLISLRAEYQLINILLSVVINLLFVYMVLRLTKRIETLLGEGGIAILKKVFGIILLAIAVKLFTSNVKELFQ
ncbi:MAG: MarC family protein [Bacteroidetes bacterium]|nr:MAG: MarC family protein [Bacteroidota bacterium]